MENYKKLKQLIETSEKDAKKFYKSNNKTAGTRLRKTMQEIKVLAQEIRKEVLDIKSKRN